MSAEDSSPRDEPAGSAPCAPCRGTGSVISGLGGRSQTITCPWCEGSGLTIPEHDAQAARREDSD